VPVTTLSLPTRAVAAPAAARTGRTLGSYLLVPRPKDLVKAVVLPLAFAVGVVADGGTSGAEVGRAVLVWVALELLVYQARYQWNDVRGFAADQAHPDAVSRGRLPGPVEKGPAHISASLAVMAVRLGLTALLAVAVPALAGLLLLMVLGVFGAAVVYERLRTAATGRTSEVPVPLRPALVGLWAAVGLGYAVRGMTGLALAAPLDLATASAAAVATWALGVVFVTCRWLLEAMCFGTAHGGRMTWAVRPDQAREHTLGLVRWLPGAPPQGTDPCAWRALQGRTPMSAPWHLALVVAASAAAVAGRLLAGPAATGDAVVAGLGGAAAALLVAWCAGARLLAGALAVVALVVLLAGQGSDRPLVAALPVAVALALYGAFTRQCADEVGKPLRRLAHLRHG
jgi:hypothetical protein